MFSKRFLKATDPPSSAGFTLIEIMIALAISGFILSGIYSAYINQQKSYITQGRVAEMQQNLRAAMFPLVSTIRMAGYDPSGNVDSLGITLAEPGRISMQIDWNGDGDTSDDRELIDFGFPVRIDSDHDGIPDAGGSASLGRQYKGAGGYHPIGDNLESIEFLYLDKDGNVTAELADIRLIQISLLTIISKPDRDFTNRTTYNPASGDNADWKRAANIDNFRRRLLITTVVCRNMGL